MLTMPRTRQQKKVWMIVAKEWARILIVVTTIVTTITSAFVSNPVVTLTKPVIVGGSTGARDFRRLHLSSTATTSATTTTTTIEELFVDEDISPALGDSDGTGRRRQRGWWKWWRSRDNVHSMEDNDDTITTATTTLAGAATNTDTGAPPEWTVYVCQSKPCLERGAEATYGAFVGLAPPSRVRVCPAIIHKPRAKGKGPLVRCLHHPTNRGLEVSGVDSVPKVYRILSVYLGITEISEDAYRCLHWNYVGNAHLAGGRAIEAVAAYNRALRCTGTADSTSQDFGGGEMTPQRGVLWLMRATAHWERSQTLLIRRAERLGELRRCGDLVIVEKGDDDVDATIERLIHLPSPSPEFEQALRRTRHAQDRYQYALRLAAHDALRSTEALPQYAKTWLRAGDCLAALKTNTNTNSNNSVPQHQNQNQDQAEYQDHQHFAADCYRRAMELDPSLRTTVEPLVEQLSPRKRN